MPYMHFDFRPLARARHVERIVEPQPVFIPTVAQLAEAEAAERRGILGRIGSALVRLGRAIGGE